MSNVIQYQGLGRRLSDTKVGGLCGWLSRQIRKFVPGGAVIANVIDEILKIEVADAPSSADSRFIAVQLTGSEELIIKAWDDTKFTPFVLSISTVITTISSPMAELLLRPNFPVGGIPHSGGTTLPASLGESQLARLNQILKNMSAVRQYYDDVAISGLSAGAQSQVIAYIDFSFRAFEKIIADTIAAFPYEMKGVEQTFSASSVALAPLVPNNTAGTFVAPQYMSVGTLPTGAVIVPVITAEPTGNTVPGGTPIIPVVSTPTGILNEIPYKKILGGLAISGILAYMFRSGKKTSNQ